ncbi:hypothetical protein ACWCPQ_16840 [Nocardia sp. NPDC001965]
MMNHAVLPLPYVTPPLSLNDSGATRGAMFAKARKRKKVREDVCRLAALAYLPRDVAHVTVQLHYRPATNHRRDTDNLVATLKPAADALAAGRPARTTGNGRKIPALVGYGMVPDDTPQWMSKPEPIIHRAEPGKAGRLWLEITWTDNPAAETVPA